MNAIDQTKKSVKNWWLFVMLGVLMVACGFGIFMNPAKSYATLAIMFSWIVFVNGLLEVFFSASNNDLIHGWGWHLALGMAKILVSVVLVINPDISMAILPVIVGFWLLFGALSTMSGAFDLRSLFVKGWGWVLATGVVLFLCSVMVISDPVYGSGAILVMTATTIVTYGAAYVALGIQLANVKISEADPKKATLTDLRSHVIKVLQDTNQKGRKVA